MPQAIPHTPENSTEFNEQRNSAPDSGSEISDIISSHEVGIEVESPAHESNPDIPVLPESQPPSSQKPNFEIYQKDKTVEPCAPTEEAGQDDIIFSGKVEIISKEPFVSNIPQTIPRLEKFKMIVKFLIMKTFRKRPNIHATKKTNKKRHTFEAAQYSWDQGDDMINVEVDHIYNESPHTESLPILNKTIHDETPPTPSPNIQAFQERRKLKMIPLVEI
ncbi:hypothetical protein O181_088415 [Austropuccinia psidii MF-1]|uniref:Uncharacterized protein n=1 Tax=Austropuccinia psidii MF-1 TaxID=1389203 RepID=A0A9Q3IRG8_9BASI|nr:hypothetical protein [Austropuccinia psidii MF-1]